MLWPGQDLRDPQTQNANAIQNPEQGAHGDSRVFYREDQTEKTG